MVGQSIRENVLRSRPNYTYCQYEEFGLSNLENRLLKKALAFVKRYLPACADLTKTVEIQDLFNYINPAFETISENISLNEIKFAKHNVFYKEYKPALHIAKLILKRFGYNITNTRETTVRTPPFWIDMSKLFELYVLGLLKNRFGNRVYYQFKSRGNELDFLLNDPDFKMVIDAKYIPSWKYAPKHDNVRQVSGYARLEKTYRTLGKEYPESIDCLIIYPENGSRENLIHDNLNHINFKVKGYHGIFKIGVRLPVITSES